MREARELQTQIEHLERHIAHLDKQLQDVKLAKPEQRPVAWLHPDKKVEVIAPTIIKWFDKPMPLYTAPQRKEWVGLTDEKIVSVYCSIHEKEWAIGGMDDVLPFTRAIEAKLKELNA